MARLDVNQDQYLELEKIALGAFAPLTGFLEEGDFISVVESMRLGSGKLFPLPVVLDVSKKFSSSLRCGDVVSIFFRDQLVGEIAVSSIYTCDKPAVAAKVYGTNDPNHPGVAHFFRMGDYFLGGEARLLKGIPLEFAEHELTPEQTKGLFKEYGMKTVAGFQTRNVPHRAHEYLHRLALEITDGLFIQPLVGKKKRGDYTPAAILAAYQVLVKEFFPKNRVVLGILSTAMRYAGPREALFHALIRRNYGCTHFIVGRDHAGVGNYYGKYEAQQLALKHQDDLGIQILPFPGPFYCAVCDGIVTERTCQHLETAPERTHQISGTQVRKILSSGDKTHKEWMRPEILKSVEGCKLFIDDESE
jgi:sulfate adenylyltransferase